MQPLTAEHARLREDEERKKNWKRWGPYLSERQWGTVREDYSPFSAVWEYFPHDHARSRVYRWGEDGLLGISDRECRLCFSLALWNGRDPILKERLFGLAGDEGNHGEDVKEEYFYLDATPTYSYLKGLYKYPQQAFPYSALVETNRRRSRNDPEFELADTGIFKDNRYFDVQIEYAKAAPDDLLIRIEARNAGPQPALLHLLPTLWFRNTWSWGNPNEACQKVPILRHENGRIAAGHESLGRLMLAHAAAEGAPPQILATNNETNRHRLFGAANETAYVKDAFHRFLVDGDKTAVNPELAGTKAAWHFQLTLAPGQSRALKLRLFAPAEESSDPFADFDPVFSKRIAEASEFYSAVFPAGASESDRRIMRQATAGLLWSKQFYHYCVPDWLQGDPRQAPPPPGRAERARNRDWRHFYAQEILSIPDKWEYPWFASWDLAFQMIPLAEIDPDFAKQQLVLLLREWYLHPNGQLPAYEFAFDDVNPPVHAWAAWRVYKIADGKGSRDRVFLERVFQKLLLNFTWWVNRKDPLGNNLFSGGFLGLDNIGVFDRSKPLPTGGTLEQADATAWMAFYCGSMLSIALELAGTDSQLDLPYEDMASKFLEHFVQITDAMNSLGGMGLWNDNDGFYYDQIRTDRQVIPLKIRSLVGLIPLLAVEILEDDRIQQLPGFSKRLDWFLKHRPDLAQGISCAIAHAEHRHRLLAIPSRARLERVLRYLLDEEEFLSPFGIRSLSKYHEKHPFALRADGQQFEVAYEPAESRTGLFGGNSNWRGPVWFPMNYLLIEALERYHHFYGDDLQVEFPTGSGNKINLLQAAAEIARRLVRIFKSKSGGLAPFAGGDRRYADNLGWNQLLLFHEFFDAETGRGLGASHQTGWTALVVRLLDNGARARKSPA